MRNIQKYNEAKRLRDTGLTLKSVGEKIGVSQERVRQMLATLTRMSMEEKGIKEKVRELPDGANIFDFLTVAAAYSLQKVGIATTAEARTALQDGMINKIGKKKLKEISELLGLEPPNA